MQLYKKQTRATQYFITTTILLALMGCSPKKNEPVINCEIDANQCLTLSTENSEILINTSVVVVEQNYQLRVSSNREIESIELKGINMNMGIIPIFLQQESSSEDKYKYKADMFLGMCSEPKMQWAATITFKNGDTESTIFNSYWQAPEN